MRVEHPVERDAVLRQRVDEPRALTVLQLADVVDLQTAGRRRRSEQAAAEARAFFVRPVHQPQRHRRRRRRRASAALRAPPPRRGSRRASRRSAPSRDGCRRSRFSATRPAASPSCCRRNPVSIAQAELGDLACEPRARVAPHRPPGEALRAVGCRGARRELAQIGDDAFSVHSAAFYRDLEDTKTRRPHEQETSCTRRVFSVRLCVFVFFVVPVPSAPAVVESELHSEVPP